MKTKKLVESLKGKTDVLGNPNLGLLLDTLEHPVMLFTIDNSPFTKGKETFWLAHDFS